MPTVLDNAKEAGYAALGLQILMFEELSERLSAQREQLDERFADQREQIQEQLEIARKHGNEARERFEPAIKNYWEAAGSTIDRVSKITPAPFDGYVTDGFARLREFMGVEVDETETAAKAKAADKKAAAKK